MRAKVAERETAKWTSPIVFRSKLDACLCLFIENRRLRAVTERDSYSIPGMDKCIDLLGKEQVFSALEANSGYLQIKMDNKDADKTALDTHHSPFCYTRMQLCLDDASTTFQMALALILEPAKWNFAIVYIDDIMSFSKSPLTHRKSSETTLGCRLDTEDEKIYPFFFCKFND